MIGVRRVWWLLAAWVVLMTTVPTVASAVPAVPALRLAPQGEYAATLTFEIDSIAPALVTDTSSTVVVSGRMVNTGSEELTGVVARWQRGPAFGSTADVQAEIDEPGQPESVLTVFSPVTDTIAAGATVPFTLQTDAFLRGRSGLAIQDPGVYPVMINVNATFASGPDDGARVGELHTLLTVASVPDGTAVVGTGQSVSMVMPLVDRPHRDPTGAFFDDDLAPLISPGGRLDDVLSAAEAPGLPAGAVTLAVDPELLEELQLMSAGYTVGPYVFDITRGTGGTTTTDTPGTSTTTSAPATSTPATASSIVSATDPSDAATTDAVSTGAEPTTGTGSEPTTGTGGTTSAGTDAPTTGTATAATTGDPSTGVPTGTTASATTASATTTTTTTTAVTSADGSYQPVPGPSAVTGTGTADAVDFLERLRELAATTPVLVLPYTDIDAVAAVRAGHPELVAAAVDRGRTLAADILGGQAELVDNVSWPIDGLVDATTLSVLRDAGMATTVLDRSGVTGATGDRATIGTDAGDVTAVLASSDVPENAIDLNHVTALTGQRWFSGDTDALVIAPPRSWQPDLAEYASVTTLLQTLSSAGLVSGARVDEAISAQAPASATVTYPEAAVGRELSPGLFGRVQELARALASTQQTFDPVATDDPTTTAPTDLFATLEEGLSRQAAGGFRVDPGAVNRSNAAVETIVASVQAGVAITPSASVYTLTSATSPLLVTIRNDLPYAAHVRILVDAADALRAGITITDIGIQTVPAFRSTTVRLPAEIIRAGSSEVAVSLTTPDGATWGAEQTLRLRSTAIGSFTVVLIIAAAAIVVLTTAIRIRKRYRQRVERIRAGLQ